jgi:excisionase family DNA binding protein
MDHVVLVTAEELAETLSMSSRTVIELARRGIIPEVRPTPRLRRFDVADVVTALKSRSDPQRANHDDRSKR